MSSEDLKELSDKYLLKSLKKHFGYDNFKSSLQKHSIKKILESLLIIFLN